MAHQIIVEYAIRVSYVTDAHITSSRAISLLAAALRPSRPANLALSYVTTAQGQHSYTVQLSLGTLRS